MVDPRFLGEQGGKLYSLLVVMCLSVVRHKLYGLGAAGDSLLILAQVIEDITKVVMRLGIVRLDLQGLGVACDRLIQAP